jgi:hypothetical protein
VSHIDDSFFYCVKLFSKFASEYRNSINDILVFRFSNYDDWYVISATCESNSEL